MIEAIWNESRGKWELKIDQQGTVISDECDVFIDGSGILKYVTICHSLMEGRLLTFVKQVEVAVN